ncbi:hypothetical protein ALI22I_15760 [Saccharothrix sp. ALI-22-I]|nr:hypothetical protein ALI22I_15760 [Saccharothrix sp. ALI-22-I]
MGVSAAFHLAEAGVRDVVLVERDALGSGRFLYATGFSGHGFMQGPAVGEVLRDLVLGREPVVDVSALDVSRFGAELRPELNIV